MDAPVETERRARSLAERACPTCGQPGIATYELELCRLGQDFIGATRGGALTCGRSDSMHPLERLDFPVRVAKRAQYEAFEFTLTPAGVVVRNGSHADPSDHEYLVEIANQIPDSCECPADEHSEWACKHRVAVAIRRPLLEAAVTASKSRDILADGGQIEATSTSLFDFETVDEDCAECIGDFPCWECVRTGRKDLPD